MHWFLFKNSAPNMQGVVNFEEEQKKGGEYDFADADETIRKTSTQDLKPPHGTTSTPNFLTVEKLIIHC